MTAPDPADTFSGHLPSLPPIPRYTSDLDVLDLRFPIRLSQPATIFWQLTQEWDDRETVIGETIRATQQHAVPEERYVQPIDFGPAALPPPPLPVLPLAHEWDTGRGTLALPAPQRHRKLPPRAPNGRFTRETPGEA
jgi:hypothetical protein